MSHGSPDPARLNSEVLLGKGLTSEVFTWGEDCAVKLFLPWMSIAAVEREFTVTRTVHEAGVPSPAVRELIQVGNRNGIVFERVRGVSLLQQVSKRPWTLFSAARRLAELHTHVHERALSAGLPSQREQIERRIGNARNLSHAELEIAKEYLGVLPEGTRLCHGDFHPANILLTTGGPIIIDWSGATCGHPLVDVAQTSVLFERAPLPTDAAYHVHLLMKVARQMLHKTYLRRYLSLRPGGMKELERWRVLLRIAGAGWREQQHI